MADNKEEYRFDSLGLIFYLWERKRPIIILTTLAVIVSIIASSLIPVKFKSEAILFPSASSSVSIDLLSIYNSRKDLLKPGEEEEVEQLLQVLQSDEIRDKIIEKYDLMKHYDIDPKSAYPRTTLFNKYADNITFTPTKFSAVKITVLDHDAQTAADIANDIAKLVDTVVFSMQHEKALKALNLVKSEYLATQDSVRILEDSLRVVMSLGVLSFDFQVERLTEALGKAIIEGNNAACEKLQKRLDELAKYGTYSISIRQNIENEKTRLQNLQTKYSEATLDVTQKLPTKFVVTKASKAEKKTYPIRWLIVVLSTFSTFVLTVLLLLVSEAIIKRINEQKALDAK